MKLTFLQLKKILPELNRQVVTVERILHIFDERRIDFHELEMEGDGCYATKDGRDYVFLRRGMNQLLFHETLALEGVHALSHFPAKFLLWRHKLEAEVLALICIMPRTDLPRLNRIKHQLDEESFELLEKRNLANERWKL